MVLEDAKYAQAGPEFAQKAALFNIETFFGWVSDVETFCDALSPTSLLISLKEFNDAKIRNYSRWQQRTAGPRSRQCWLMAWCMSPVRWL